MAEANKFFVTYEPASHQGPECIHFAAFVPRSLSLADAKELRDVLTELLPEPEPAPPISPPVSGNAGKLTVRDETPAEEKAREAVEQAEEDEEDKQPASE